MVIMVEGERSKRTTRVRRIGIDFGFRILSSSFAEPGASARPWANLNFLGHGHLSQRLFGSFQACAVKWLDKGTLARRS
jgi:hypothetical protein